jgi:hypothetical protein
MHKSKVVSLDPQIERGVAERRVAEVEHREPQQCILTANLFLGLLTSNSKKAGNLKVRWNPE